MPQPDVFDFDEITEWAPRLCQHLRGHDLEQIAKTIRETETEYWEDSRDILLRAIGRDEAANQVAIWLKAQTVIGYHGTRLSPADLESVRARGLIPLTAADRKVRLTRSLSAHARWGEVEPKLDEAIELFGAKDFAGRREGQVHLTASRAGLTESFNHYLEEGSEFDGHIAQHLLGDEGRALIMADGTPYLIKAAVPGSLAYDACNPYPEISHDLPNLVEPILTSLACWLADESFRSAAMELDCGIVLYEAVPPDWLDIREYIQPSQV